MQAGVDYHALSIKDLLALYYAGRPYDTSYLERGMPPWTGALVDKMAFLCRFKDSDPKYPWACNVVERVPSGAPLYGYELAPWFLEAVEREIAFEERSNERADGGSVY